ncbi:MAG: hypothetical protein O8C63_11275 [Candidatus Methanoperedens sp.]|nr:hypothetical protein [Candidatus Methanoperedens sp.]
MGLADIPTSFGSSFFIRTFFPASIATALYSFAFYEILKNSFWFTLSFENKILVLIMISLLIGILLNICDIYIYQLYEGIWGWPNFLKKYFHSRLVMKFIEYDTELKKKTEEKNKLETNIENLNNTEKERAEEELWLLNKDISKLSAELRKFPYNPDYNRFCQRYPEKPTEFGNVIEEYELYSEKQYGMHMMVFWQHLWFIIPKELRDDLDLRSAKADFSVYMSILLLFFLPIGTIGFWFQSNTWYQVFSWNLPIYSIVAIVFSILGCYIFYKVSISEHKVYGRYIKAVFDLYRFDLASKLDIGISKSPDLEKKEWKKLRNYFLDYRYF